MWAWWHGGGEEGSHGARLVFRFLVSLGQENSECGKETERTLGPWLWLGDVCW